MTTSGASASGAGCGISTTATPARGGSGRTSTGRSPRCWCWTSAASCVGSTARASISSSAGSAARGAPNSYTRRVDSRARVAAALAGGDVDRPPAGAWGHRYRDEWTPEKLAQVTIDRATRFGWDFVKFQPRATFFAEAFGAAYRPAGHALRAPVIDEPPVRTLEDWEHLKLVNQDVLDEQARTLGVVVKGLGGRVPVLQTVFSPLSVASYLVGRENRRLVREMRSRPEIVLPALNRIGDVLIDFSRK